MVRSVVFSGMVKFSIFLPPTECLVEMLTLVAKHSNFTFDGNHCLQINGTAMGTKMAPSYANIFMGDLEERLLLSSLKQPFPYFSTCGNSVIMENVRAKGSYIHGNKRGIFWNG
jgi:hypothetical protein